MNGSICLLPSLAILVPTLGPVLTVLLRVLQALTSIPFISQVTGTAYLYQRFQSSLNFETQPQPQPLIGQGETFYQSGWYQHPPSLDLKGSQYFKNLVIRCCWAETNFSSQFSKKVLNLSHVKCT